MNFQPVVPFGGLSGWAFLSRTQEAQKAAFSQNTSLVREADYFMQRIGEIDTAEQLVEDRALLKVALGAFGLDDDIGNKYFVQKVLEEGTLNDGALANRLADKRYQDFSSAFGFGNFDVPRTKLSTFSDEILSRYKNQQFEAAVGDKDQSMRLAMGMQRELADLSAQNNSNNGKWFTIMGNPPLRSVFETAFNLPSSFGAIDIDKQLDIFKSRSDQVFGTSNLEDFSRPDIINEVTRVFLAQSEIQSIGSIATSGSIALTLLRG